MTKIREFWKEGAMLAPMAGVTDMPFRVLCREMGCAMAVSEMLSAKGYMMSGEANRAARELLATSPLEEGAVALQLFGSDPGIMAAAADRLTASGRYAFLDINMGCPVPKIVGNGEGSALLKNPQLAAEVVKSTVEAAQVPVTVKLRIGFEAGSEECLTLGPALEKAGASMLTLHARTRSQFYEGRADWSMIRRLKERVGIPVIGNGDVDSPEAALRMLEETGCDGAAVGRAAQGNPWLFGQIACAMQGKPVREIGPEEKYAVLVRHIAMLSELKGEAVAVREMRRHIVCYVRGMRDAAKLRTRINSITDAVSLKRELSLFMLGHAQEA